MLLDLDLAGTYIYKQVERKYMQSNAGDIIHTGSKWTGMEKPGKGTYCSSSWSAGEGREENEYLLGDTLVQAHGLRER